LRLGQDQRGGLLEGARFRDNVLTDPREKIPGPVPVAHLVAAELGCLRARNVLATVLLPDPELPRSTMSRV